ncbi:hypothetical protein L7F22_021121 [Adiantum nelumboides]|nr:hypothetical protein [Adiantum nelumboides]
MRIHNVFHVSFLKKYVFDPLHILNHDDAILINQEDFQMEPEKYVFDPLHILNHDDAILINQEDFQMEPEQVLEVKERKLRHQTLHEVLVKWKGYTIEDASWENWDDIVAHFSHFG